ncbi:MAG: hypothetical protein AAF529_07260 [Pseudomonadota bacterium]
MLFRCFVIFSFLVSLSVAREAGAVEPVVVKLTSMAVGNETQNLPVRSWQWLNSRGAPQEGRAGQIVLLVQGARGKPAKADYVGQRVELSIPHRITTAAGETQHYQWQLNNAFIKSYSVNGDASGRMVVRYGNLTLKRG